MVLAVFLGLLLHDFFNDLCDLAGRWYRDEREYRRRPPLSKRPPGALKRFLERVGY